MKLKKLLPVVLLLSLLSGYVFAAPGVIDVADTKAESGFDTSGVLLEDNMVVLDLGAKKSDKNVRLVEIDGVQTEIEENANTCKINLGSSNMLVEITEKTSVDAQNVVSTQYFYIDVKNKTAERIELLDNAMQSYEEKSIRTSGEKGIRFKAHASTAAKRELTRFVVDEYGYLITTRESLGNKDLTFSSKKFVKGIGFSREKNINIVFDATNDDYDVFTLVLKNIPVEHYDDEIVCKTYTKLKVHGQNFVVYGEQMSGNVYDVAKKSFSADYGDTEIAKMVFDYCKYAGADEEHFGGAVISSSVSAGESKVTGTFSKTVSSDTTYNVYLATYNQYGTMISVRKSANIVMKNGLNNFEISFSLSDVETQTNAFVFTSGMEFVGCEDKGNWQITEEDFYNSLASASFSCDEGYFEPDSNVSVIEAITVLSSVHAKFNNKNVESQEHEYLHFLEFDDADMLVDLSERNSRNDDKINFGRATGGIDEEKGYIYGQTDLSEGKKDPQVVINCINLDARRYNKVKLRMKYENAPGDNTNLANQTFQMFFKTNFASSLTEGRSIKRVITGAEIAKGWFEIELDMSNREDWKDVITGIRVDPANCNLKFYIDYIEFSQSESTMNDTWYDRYLDYAHANNVISLGQYRREEFVSDITRKDVFFMIFDSFPDSAFTPINNITALPDIGKNENNVDFYLMLYNSGLTLGFDEKGNLGLDSPITRSQLAELANRLLVPANRLKGTVDASWEGEEYKHDVEFNSPSDLNRFNLIRKMDNKVVENGCYSFTAQYDSYMIAESVSIDADVYSKIKVRMKAKYDADPGTNGSLRSVSVYFRPKTGYDGYPEHYAVSMQITDYYLDLFGWYVFEIDMFSLPNWEGEISYFRFDPMNSAGSYSIDYIRFIKSPYGEYRTQQDLINAGFVAKKLMPDGFKNGFLVSRVDGSVKWDGLQQRKWSFPESTGEPVWSIGPWWQGTGEGFSEIDLWENRIMSNNGYTIADSYGVNTITYNPELDSITQRLNATKIYNGKPHDMNTYKWWPHQLFDTNQNFTSTVDMEYNSADADRMFVELDIRMTDFKPTTNTEGMNVCSYLAYFYLRPKTDPGQLIWFGLNLFSGASLSAPTNIVPNWSPDSAAHQYMYGMPQAVVYDGIENSFNPSRGVAAVSDEWKHIRLDVTPHIDRAIEWANRDNAFGFHVEKEDMFFNGVNIGYEIHGNFDVTFEIKNFNIVAYNKP